MRALCAQQDHMRVFHIIVECAVLMDVNAPVVLPFFGTSYQPCRLLEA